MDITKSLQKLDYCEDLLELMESQLYQIPNLDLMTKWENRYQSHKVRINNFRKILNGTLSSKMISMRDEIRTLSTQLEQYTNGDVVDGGYEATMNSLQGMADLHSQQLYSGSLARLSTLTTPKRGKGQKGKSPRTKGRSGLEYFQICLMMMYLQLILINLVYTKGTKLSSKESETLINRVKLKKKEIKKLTKHIKKLKEEHKIKEVQMKTTIDSQRTKLRSYEKARQSMVEKQQAIQKQMGD